MSVQYSGKDCISLSVSEGDVSNHFPPLSVSTVCVALVKIKYINHWSHSLCHDILVQQHNQPSNKNCFSSNVVLEKSLLTGWSWSKSGSNFVTRWWHLSRSAIFFGNQWTSREKEKTNGQLLFNDIFVSSSAGYWLCFKLAFWKAKGCYIWLLWWF